MKQKIIELREKGYTYKQISQELKCSTSTISYHIGVNVKANVHNRVTEYKKQNPLITKISNYKLRKSLYSRVNGFNVTRDNSAKYDTNFTMQEFLDKIGSNPVCYLTGEPIDIFSSADYQLDHIMPSSKGGSNELDNLGLTKSYINQMKRDMSVEEFIAACRKVVDYADRNKE